MRKRRLLLATSALTTALGCSHDKKPVIYANPKGSHYVDAGVAPQDTEQPPTDGGVSQPPSDGGAAPGSAK